MLKKSLIIATCITLTLFGIILYIGTLYAQYNPGTGTQYPPKHSGQGGRDFGYYFHEVGTAGTYIQYYGTQSVTGSGTTGRIIGTSSALPHVEYAYAGGTPTFNFVGATLQNEGNDVTVGGDLSNYIAVTGGTGTGNVLTDTTLAGAGTISANVTLSGNITANSLEITPTELGYLDNAGSEIQAQITTAIGSITNHVHTGADGTTQMSHNSVTGTGTNSHSTLDTFVSSKAQASGLASLDGSSLVVQNPANGTTTPTANKIVIADGSGKTADGWLNSTVSLLGQTIELGTETTGNTDNVVEGSSNLYYLDSRVNAAVGSLSVNALSDVNISFNENDFIKIVGGQLVAGSSSVSAAWSSLTGNPTDNGSISVASGAGYIPVAGSDGKLDYSWQKDVIRLTGTTTSPEAGAYGQLYVQSSSSGGGFADSVLMLKCDNIGTTTFVDSSPTPKTITAQGNAIGTSTVILQGGSYYGDGTTDALMVTDHDDLTLGTSDFTIGFTIRFISVANIMFVRHINGTTYQYITYENNLSGANDIAFIAATAGVVKADYRCEFNSPSAATNYHFEFTRSGTNFYIFIDGVSQSLTVGTAISTNSLPDVAANMYLMAAQDLSASLNGYMDGFYIIKGRALHTTGFTPPNTDTTESEKYTQYSAKYDDPVNGNTVFEILTPGTATTEASYIYNNATTTVFGLGTNTAITATSTAYSGWFAGAVRATAFNVASTEKIKENIKPIRIKPEQLEAESRAKPIYIADKKPAWFVANEANYTYVGTETGTGTVTYIDNAAMEADYATHIELEWASDLNRNVYVDAVQKAQEKYFWQMFDGIQPKSWNPKDKLNLERKGFIAEEMPDVVKGDDKQSIDPMSLIAYIAVSLQSIKQDNITVMQALRDFAATGTFTASGIEDRLEVLETAP